MIYIEIYIENNLVFKCFKDSLSNPLRKSDYL